MSVREETVVNRNRMFLALGAMIHSGCEEAPVTDRVSIEGTVEYYSDTVIWIGGECDHSGFILSNYQWISGEPDVYLPRIYVNNVIDSSYLSKRLHIAGILDTISAGGVETPLRKLLKIKSEEIRILN